MRQRLLGAPKQIIRLYEAEAQSPWAQELQQAAEVAAQSASQRLGLSFNASLQLRTFDHHLDLERYTGSRLENVVAVARGRHNQVLVVRPDYIAMTPHARAQVLVHEMTHILLAQNVKGTLPAWLNEGLAMMTARQWDMGYAWRLMLGGTLGELLPLERLQYSVLFGGEAQTLAYAQSQSVTRFWIERAYGPQQAYPGDPAPLARALADPSQGPVLLRRVWDSFFLESLETLWRREYKGLWVWVGALTGSSSLWMFISGLFLLAYWRKRRFTAQARQRLEEEEALNETPTGDLDLYPWEVEDEDFLDGEDEEDGDGRRGRHRP